MLRKTLLLTILYLSIGVVCEAGSANDKITPIQNDLKTTVKSAAVTAVSYVSPSAANTLNSTNITQTFYKAPDAIAGTIKDTTKSVAVKAVGYVSPSAADTLRSTNVLQTMRQTIYSAPANFSGYLKDTAVATGNSFNSFGQTMLTNYNNFNSYIGNKVDSAL